MTAPDVLLEKAPCVRVGATRAQHLSRIVLAADRTQWELHTWCGHDLTGVEFTSTFTIPTCPTCLDSTAAAHPDKDQS